MILWGFLMLNSCKNTAEESVKSGGDDVVYPSSVSPIFEHFKLILGDGSNVGFLSILRIKISFMLTMMVLKIG